MESLRTPYQGIAQIIRFNWHFYVWAVGAIAIGLYLAGITDGCTRWLLIAAVIFGVLVICVSLLSSYIAYDKSDLYSFSWLPEYLRDKGKDIVNIHAGFDEVSAIIQKKLEPGSIHVFDFFNPSKHTEISIRRARRARPPFPGTIAVETNRLPMESQSAHIVFLFLSAHEIRNADERVLFMREVHRVLRADGAVVLTEHLRDRNNFLAYNIGFFHFHSSRTWMKVFENSGFMVSEQLSLNPFISTFILHKHG